ncbi:unnamed protein product, partial [Cercopithifilaria johnstoni]
MEELRSDNILFQHQQLTAGGSSKGWLNQQMKQLQKALNITTVAPKSIVSEVQFEQHWYQEITSSDLLTSASAFCSSVFRVT